MSASSRYELLVKIASGGMATVYVGRLRGAQGFWRLCAIKRAHGHLVEDESLKKMLISEARLASKIHHPNVVAIDDVEELAGELRLVMDYVEGASLSELTRAKTQDGRPLPARIALRIALDACAGLHAAHQLTDDAGEPMRLVHRDVSPQNILVGLDGTSRLADFGIAKCARSSMNTTTGAIKGKLGYMAPEYVEGGEPDAKSDVFALGVVVWEALAQRKLFRGTNEIDTLKRVVSLEAPTLSSIAPWVGEHLDAVLQTALEKSPQDRFDTAQAFGAALESAARRDDLIGSHAEVGAHVRATVGEALAKRRAKIRERIAAEPEVKPTTQPHERVPIEALRERTLESAPAVDPVQDEGSTLEGSGVTSQPLDSLLEPAGVPAPRRLGRAGLIAVAAFAVGVVGFVLLRGTGPRASTQDAVDSAAQAAQTATGAVGASAATSKAEATATASASAAFSAPQPTAQPPLRGTLPRPARTADAAPRAATAAPTKETVAPNPYGKKP